MRKDGSLVPAPWEACLPLERLDGKDAKVLLIWILAGILGAGVAYTYFFRAFPEASVEFKVPRADALDIARQFAAAQGAQIGGYDSSIVFNLDDTAKTYLERQIGLQQANQMMANDVHIWYWQTRFFRPLQKEEYDVRVNPAGGIVGYTHELEEAAPGARLERAAAQAAAEAFLRDALHADLSRYDFREEEANFTERPARRDWSFAWERRGFRAKDATYRLIVTLAGDRVSGYSEFLKVPEAWTRDYEHLRSSNNVLEFIALIPYAFLIGGCLYVIVSLGRRGLLEWRTGLALGIFLTVLFFLMTMNQWPLDRAEYDTNTPYYSFFFSQVGQAALLSVASALLVVLAVVPGEPLYRIFQPDKLRLEVGFRLPGIRTREFFRANVIGVCLAAAHIGYITVFYIVSSKLGAWAPQDLNYENVVSTYVPWVYPLTIGIYAATSEEFLFRLFAIPFLLRVTKSRLLAVVLPAFFWGFLHSNYPQEPAYIRGLEVGLIGIVAGLVLLRWGIWATLIWHYTVDAFLISTSLLRSHGAYLRLSGAVVGGAALIPLAIAAVSYLSRGGFVADASLLNSARPIGGPPMDTSRIEPGKVAPSEIAHAAEAPDIPVSHAAMSSRSMAVLIACGMLGIALAAGIKREAIGDFVRFQIDAREATERGNEDLRQINVDPATYHRAATVTYTFDDFTNEYLRRTIGIAAANRIYRDQVPSAFWTIRYFRDSQKEEYFVVLKPDGSLHSVHHTLDEKAPGANFSKEEAQARAEVFLRDRKGVNFADWNLVETHTDKKPARTDHTFEWEQKTALEPTSAEPAAAGAHIRMQLQVQGDEVSGYRVFIKIPETWRDAESRETPAQLAQKYGLALGTGIALIAVFVIFLRSLKSPDVARAMARPREIVLVNAAGGDRDLRKPDPADPSDLHDGIAAGDLLRHHVHLPDFHYLDLCGRGGPLAGTGLVFPGRRVWPRAHCSVARMEARIFPGRILLGAFRFRRGVGSGAHARAVGPLAVVAPYAGIACAGESGPAQPRGRGSRFRNRRRISWRGNSWTRGRPDRRLRSRHVDARRPNDSLCHPDGHKCGDARRVFPRGHVPTVACRRALVRSRAHRPIQRAGLLPARRDADAGSRRDRFARAAQSLPACQRLRRPGDGHRDPCVAALSVAQASACGDWLERGRCYGY
jgi:hypothetical protein